MLHWRSWAGLGRARGISYSPVGTITENMIISPMSLVAILVSGRHRYDTVIGGSIVVHRLLVWSDMRDSERIDPLDRMDGGD